MVSYLYMTTRRIVSLSAAFVLLFVALPFAPAQAKNLSVTNVAVPEPLSCEARTTRKIIRTGGFVDIVWKSEGAEKMIGLVKGSKEWPVEGRQRFSTSVLGKHIFPMTFIGKNGNTTTCSVTIFVHPKRK